jgi:hypothetical protein
MRRPNAGEKEPRRHALGSGAPALVDVVMLAMCSARHGQTSSDSKSTLTGTMGRITHRFGDVWLGASSSKASDVSVCSNAATARCHRICGSRRKHDIEFEFSDGTLPPLCDQRVDRITSRISARRGICVMSRDEVMHTGYVAFGMDRLALAMFATHGLNVAGWPQIVRKALTM